MLLALVHMIDSTERTPCTCRHDHCYGTHTLLNGGLRKKKQHNSMDGSFSTLNTSEIFRGSRVPLRLQWFFDDKLRAFHAVYALQTACLFWLDQFSVNRDSSCHSRLSAYRESSCVFICSSRLCHKGALFVVLAVFNLDTVDGSEIPFPTTGWMVLKPCKKWDKLPTSTGGHLTPAGLALATQGFVADEAWHLAPWSSEWKAIAIGGAQEGRTTMVTWFSM